MIIYDILLTLQYQVSSTVMDSIVVFALFVFMLALLCFCVATVFSVKKIYILTSYPLCPSSHFSRHQSQSPASSHNRGSDVPYFHLSVDFITPCAVYWPASLLAAALTQKTDISHPGPDIPHFPAWLGGAMVRAFDLRLEGRAFDPRPFHFQVATLGQFVRIGLRVPLSPSSKFRTGQEAVMPCGWEGNRRSGVTLAVHHRLQWFIHLRAYGVRKGGEHPAYTPHGVWHTSLFYIPLCGFV